jgi:hypothetical protein
MSSNLLDRVRRSFSLRLILWYAAVSVLAYMIVFALAYRSLSFSLVIPKRALVGVLKYIHLPESEFFKISFAMLEYEWYSLGGPIGNNSSVSESGEDVPLCPLPQGG